MAFFDHYIWAWVYLGLFGVSSGLMVTCVPLLGDVYGTQHIGSIAASRRRSPRSAQPGHPSPGLGLDAAVPLETMAMVGSVYVVVVTVMMVHACQKGPRKQSDERWNKRIFAQRLIPRRLMPNVLTDAQIAQYKRENFLTPSWR